MIRAHGCQPYFPAFSSYITNMPKSSQSESFDLFGTPDLGPLGFRYQPDFVSPTEEQDLVASIAKLPLRPFEFFGHLGNRRVVWFGQRYDYDDGRSTMRSHCRHG
jgi:hypothetical protein